MENKSNLEVTFSKRRTGLFNKSNELTTLCGAEMLVIVFSPAEKVFSFGHPSVDELADRFMGIRGSSSSMGHSHETQRLLGIESLSNINEMNARFIEVQELLKAEKTTQKGDGSSHASWT
ncbi:agamous-like MADS-box protein AGL62 [Impatiens glandulifera]|uniref:agamous-like MADS-box protein AGL62 n=1 Tax=Impatiens glandulifera TaxID=253017 RepID=UPI001FB14421|nr:agamous-like MADS-box protein AGL62 [Impatiens glandulifera]